MADGDAVASIAVLPWFHDPYIFDICMFLSGLQFVIDILECFELLVLDSFGYVEGQWDGLEDVGFFEEVVFFEMVEEWFFIADVVVLLEVVVEEKFLGGLEMDYIFAGEELCSVFVGFLGYGELCSAVFAHVSVPVYEVGLVEDAVVALLQANDGLCF